VKAVCLKSAGARARREAFDAGELIGLTAEGEAEAERLLAQRKRKAAA
jgi:hypothetical protein